MGKIFEDFSSFKMKTYHEMRVLSKDVTSAVDLAIVPKSVRKKSSFPDTVPGQVIHQCIAQKRE